MLILAKKMVKNKITIQTLFYSNSCFREAELTTALLCWCDSYQPFLHFPENVIQVRLSLIASNFSILQNGTKGTEAFNNHDIFVESTS